MSFFSELSPLGKILCGAAMVAAAPWLLRQLSPSVPPSAPWA